MSIKQWKQAARIDEEGKPRPYLIGAREGDTFTLVFHSDHLAEMERLMDLVRYSRQYLFDENLLSTEEFAALVEDSQSGQRVARLKSYDAVRKSHLAEMEEARKLMRELIAGDASFFKVNTFLEGK